MVNFDGMRKRRKIEVNMGLPRSEMLIFCVFRDFFLSN